MWEGVLMGMMGEGLRVGRGEVGGGGRGRWRGRFGGGWADR